MTRPPLVAFFPSLARFLCRRLSPAGFFTDSVDAIGSTEEDADPEEPEEAADEIDDDDDDDDDEDAIDDDDATDDDDDDDDEDEEDEDDEGGDEYDGSVDNEVASPLFFGLDVSSHSKVSAGGNSGCFLLLNN